MEWQKVWGSGPATQYEKMRDGIPDVTIKSIVARCDDRPRLTSKNEWFVMTISCTPVILCRAPLDNAGHPVGLRVVCGTPIINILNLRLKAIRQIKHPVLLMSSYEPHTAKAA